jgi:azurin
MKRIQRFWVFGFLTLSALFLAACGQAAGATPTNTINIGTDGAMAFDQTGLTVRTGEQVTLTFTNDSTMQHNWVLVNGGDDVATRVDEAGIAAGPPEYLPANSPDVIAHTRMLNAGENQTITFTAPAPGTYTFFCSFPGHLAGGMKGTLTVVN